MQSNIKFYNFKPKLSWTFNWSNFVKYCQFRINPSYCKTTTILILKMSHFKTDDVIKSSFQHATNSSFDQHKSYKQITLHQLHINSKNKIKEAHTKIRWSRLVVEYRTTRQLAQNHRSYQLSHCRLFRCFTV